MILNNPLGGRRTHKEMARERQKYLYLKDWAVIFVKEPKALWSTAHTQWLLQKSQEIGKGTRTPDTEKLIMPQKSHHGPLGAKKNPGTPWHFSLHDTYRKVELLRGRQGVKRQRQSMGSPLPSQRNILLYLKPCNFVWTDSFSSLHRNPLNSQRVRLRPPADQVTRSAGSLNFHLEEWRKVRDTQHLHKPQIIRTIEISWRLR